MTPSTSSPLSSSRSTSASTKDAVPGLILVPDFVSIDEERDILARIGDPPPELSFREHRRHRVLRYGPGVHATGYESGTVEEVIPSWLADLAARVGSRPPWTVIPNAVTVNEYLPTQSITPHTDRESAGVVISSLSLASDAVMVFCPAGKRITHEVTLRPRTLVHMTGECRHTPWRHGILPVEHRRLSIVFRYGC